MAKAHSKLNWCPRVWSASVVGRASRWNSLRALRVLRWYNGGKW